MLMRQDAKSLALFEAIAAKLQSTDPLPYLQRARDWAAHFSRQRTQNAPKYCRHLIGNGRAR